MITIVAKRIVMPEKIDEFKALALKLVKASRKEAGCIPVQLAFQLTFAAAWFFPL
ncbi:MAG: putative quinol monooxygenase [Bacillota bacterium]|jgi:quinol monooxygenase YgiN